MSKVNVFDQGWIDLVFEGRNKDYGAYQLRRQESKTTLIALFSGIGLLLSLIAIPAAINYYKPVAVVEEPTFDKPIEPTEYVVPVEKLKPKTPEPITEPAHPAEAAPQNTAPTIAFRQPRPTSAPVVDPVPTQTQLQQVNVAGYTSQGTGEGGIDIGPTSNTGGNGSGTGATDGTGEAVNMAVLDEAPMFPGGLQKFYDKVGNAFNVPTVNEVTTLRVYVSFVVEKDGTMSNIKVLRDPGYGAGKEAIRVLESIKTKWKPGKMHGKVVRTAYNLPITLNIK